FQLSPKTPCRQSRCPVPSRSVPSLHSSNVDTGKALVSADPTPAVITPVLLEHRNLSTSEPTLLQVRATTVRACVLVSLLVKTVSGVRGDPRKRSEERRVGKEGR